MHPLALVYIYAAVCSVVHSAAHAIAGRLLGADVEEISLFGGPTVARFRLGGTVWLVNLLPNFGGHIKFRDKAEDDFGAAFSDLNPLRRTVIVASGSLTVAVVALICLGPIGGTRSVWHGFRQLVTGGLHPLTDGPSLVRSLLELVRVSPVTIGLGVVAAKRAAWTLLPLLPNDGGQIVWNLVDWRSRLPERLKVGVTSIGLICQMLLLAGWLIAIGVVLYGG